MSAEFDDIDVYVSYFRDDRDRATEIVTLLISHGIRIGWDQNLQAGSSWSEGTSQMLKGSKAVVVIWSASSVESAWVQQEAEHALAAKKVVPIRFDDVEIPAPHNSVTWINWSTNVDRDVAPIDRLLYSLSRLGVSPGLAEHQALAAANADNKGYAFISHVEEDVLLFARISSFLKTRRYAYWTYHESERDYQKPTVLEIEERMLDAALVLTVISPDWKRSDWTQRELAFAREIGKPLFHLRFRNPGPTLAIAGDTYIDFERGEEVAFSRLGMELDRKRL